MTSPWPLPIRLALHLAIMAAAAVLTQFIYSQNETIGIIFGVLCVMCALGDIQMFGMDWVRIYRSRPPIEQYFRHASQGAATMAVTYLFACWSGPSWAYLIKHYSANHVNFWVAVIMFGGPFLFGLVRLIAGVIVLWDVPMFDIVLSVRAFIRHAIGLAIIVSAWPLSMHIPTTDDQRMNNLVMAVGAWIWTTGLVRLVFVTGILHIGYLISLLANRMRRRLDGEMIYGKGGLSGDSVTVIERRLSVFWQRPQNTDRNLQ